MKKILIPMLAALLSGAGCSSADPCDATQGYGTLSIHSEADPTIVSRAAQLPSGDDFALTLSGAGYRESWTSVAEFNAAAPRLFAGTYTASVSWGDPQAEGAGKPCYAGEADIEVVALKQNSARIRAQIVNSQAFVTATEAFLRYFHDAQFVLTTQAGGRFEFRPGSDEPGERVFVCAGGELSVAGTARRQSPTGAGEGPLVEFRAEPLAAAQPRTCHIFRFDASDAGSAVLEITLDDSTTIRQQVEIELNEAAKPEI